MVHQRLAVLIAFGIWCPTLAAQEAQPATDTDLRAAYCLAAENVALDTFTKGLASLPDSTPPQTRNYAQAQVNEVTEDVNRLRAYVIPKLQYVDPLALAAATARGRADVQSAMTEVTNCQSSSAGSQEAMKACVYSAPAGTRVRSCKGATFLPY